MGDGISDLAARNEGSYKDAEDYILSKIDDDGGVLLCHRRSVLLGYHSGTISRLRNAGRIDVKERDDWLEISRH